MFIYFEREQERAREREYTRESGRGVERETESQVGSECDVGLELMNYEIMT